MSCHHLVYYIIIYIEPFGGINNVQNKHCLPTPMFAGWKQLCLLTLAGDVNPFHPFWQGWKDLVSVHWPLLTSGTCSCSTLWAREPSTCKGCSMSSWQGWKDLVSVIAPVWQGALVAAAPFWQGSQAPVEGQSKILAHVFPELYGLCLCQIFFFQLLLDVCNDLLVLLCPFGRHFHNKVQFFAVLGGSACDVRSWDRLVGITNPQLHPRCPASRQSHLLARWLGSRHFQNLSILLARFGTTFFFFAFFFLARFLSNLLFLCLLLFASKTHSFCQVPFIGFLLLLPSRTCLLPNPPSKEGRWCSLLFACFFVLPFVKVFALAGDFRQLGYPLESWDTSDNFFFQPPWCFLLWRDFCFHRID